MLLFVQFFAFLFYLVNSDTVVYLPSTIDPPHGCPNYGLCSNPSFTVVETNVSTTYEYDTCPPDDCICVNGTTNSTGPCDTIVDQCTPNPCDIQYPYLCTSSIGSYTCTCEPGYTGTNCNTAIDSACGSLPCENGGTCTEAANSTSYTCTCAGGYSGTNCEMIDTCYQVNCNYGTCQSILNNSTYYCECPDSYQGRNCETVNTVVAPPALQGCYLYDKPAIAALTTKFGDALMTVEKCDAYAQTMTPPMEYLTLCGTWCMVSSTSITNTSATGGYCSSTCPGNYNEYCGKLSQRCIVYTSSETVEDINNCTNTSLCGEDIGSGQCVNLAESSGGYQCVCGPSWTGENCETPIPLACDSQPCVNGTCVQNSQLNTYTCDCDPGFTGTNCQYTDICTSSTCQYGGTCSETISGGYICACLSLYSGTNCETVDRCTYNNPCANGTCLTVGDGISANYSCTCDPGWDGENCDEMINYCTLYHPCQYNSTCIPKLNGYTCDCIVGVTDVNCSTIIDLCVPTLVGTTYVKTPCNTKDPLANCTKEINSFTCSCSDKWTNTLCDLNVLIKNVLVAIYGFVDTNMISLLNDLMQNPSEIKDMVPFITGLLSDGERSDLSWDASDIFNWIAFEDQRLDLNNDIYKWNDVVLGNCFTFNHQDQNFTYLMRSPGNHGGILAYMKTDQAEYAPWYDTAAINVFVHNREEYVFSESVRYNAQPNAKSTINIFNTWYTKLGGKYGACVTKTSQVKAYYYPGAYTTDGCLRTCYQDMIQKNCDCMDPRYPSANNATSCQLSQRSCVNEASNAAGDPSTWSSCVCPLPCSNQQYSVTWSKADFVEMPIQCQMSNDQTTCQSNYQDSLLIAIVLPQLDFQLYSETPAMDFNKFLSQLGGQLGVLMGINLVSFIEIIFLIFGVLLICCRKYE